MRHEIECNWIDEMAFKVETDGHRLIIDANPEFGGQDRGPRPKPLLLASLAGCTGIDVISILKKMRVNLEGLHIKVSASLTEEHPKIYDKIIVTYTFKGYNLPMEKLEKAVQLSEEKYCGVSAMLKKAGLIEYNIITEESEKEDHHA